MLRIALCVSVLVMMATRVNAQEAPPLPYEPLGAIFSAGGLDAAVEQRNMILGEDNKPARRHFITIAPGIADAKGAFTSSIATGYVYNNGTTGSFDTSFNYANIGIEAGSANRDLFAFRARGRLTPFKGVSVAGVLDQRHLQDSYDRTKGLFAADLVFKEVIEPDAEGNLKPVFQLIGVVNAGVVRNSPLKGETASDAVFGVGLITSMAKLSKLSIGVDYRFRNKVEGAEAVSITFRHLIGSSLLAANVDKKRTISLSFFTTL